MRTRRYAHDVRIGDRRVISFKNVARTHQTIGVSAVSEYDKKTVSWISFAPGRNEGFDPR